jgi:hypothetical protein
MTRGSDNQARGTGPAAASAADVAGELSAWGRWRGHHHRSPSPARDTHPCTGRGRGAAASGGRARGRTGGGARDAASPCGASLGPAGRSEPTLRAHGRRAGRPRLTEPSHGRCPSVVERGGPAWIGATGSASRSRTTVSPICARSINNYWAAIAPSARADRAHRPRAPTLKPAECRAIGLRAAVISYSEIAELNNWTYTKVNRSLAGGAAVVGGRGARLRGG